MLSNHTNHSDLFHHWQYQGNIYIWCESGEYTPFKYTVGMDEAFIILTPQPPNIKLNSSTTSHINNEITAKNCGNVESQKLNYIIWSRRYNLMGRNSNNTLGLPENNLLRCYIMWRKIIIFDCEILPNCSWSICPWHRILDSPIRFWTKLPHELLQRAFQCTSYAAIQSCRTNCMLHVDMWNPSHPFTGFSILSACRLYGTLIWDSIFMRYALCECHKKWNTCKCTSMILHERLCIWFVNVTKWISPCSN